MKALAKPTIAQRDTKQAQNMYDRASGPTPKSHTRAVNWTEMVSHTVSESHSIFQTLLLALGASSGNSHLMIILRVTDTRVNTSPRTTLALNEPPLVPPRRHRKLNGQQNSSMTLFNAGDPYMFLQPHGDRTSPNSLTQT
ncbi:hypothetical protein L1887_24282 [Cichorium endivia]|nr:hypothetical protein L1887_24282 [Cichorium endivia]